MWHMSVGGDPWVAVPEGRYVAIREAMDGLGCKFATFKISYVEVRIMKDEE